MERFIQMKSMLLAILLAVCTSSCLPKNAFAPPPDAYEHWLRPGSDDVTTWKHMLECNYPEPFRGGRGIEDGERTFDQVVASMICMERLGYSYLDEKRVIRVCESPAGWRGSASCLPGAKIPVPDMNRRLNSGYCKRYPQSRACVP